MRNYIIKNIKWDAPIGEAFEYLPSEVLLTGAPGDNARDDESYISERLFAIYNFCPSGFTITGAPDCHIS